MAVSLEARARMRVAALASVASRSRISLEEALETALVASVKPSNQTRSSVVVKMLRLQVWEADLAAATLALAKVELVDSKHLA